MATTKFNVDLLNQQLPADYRQRKLATLFSSTPGENIQPFPYWYHNVVPTARGFKSVSYERMDSLPAVDSTLTQYTLPTYYTVESATLYTIQIYVVNNKLFTYNYKDLAWQQSYDLGASTTQPTLATVSGNSYMFHPTFGLKCYNVSTLSWDDVTLDWGKGVTPPPMANFLGITDNTGYLLLFDDVTVYWSSPTNPETFALADSLGVATGAGSTRIQAALGIIQTIEPIAGGAIVYTNKNMVSMRYTNNARNPWSFVELPDSAGVIGSQHIANDIARAYHYVWTTHGIMQVNLAGAKRILPEWTQQISSDLFFVDGADATVRQEVSSLALRVSVAAGSVLILSVGREAEPYSTAWTYDLDLNRWGRLQIPHIDIKQYILSPIITTYQALIDKNHSFNDLVGTTMRSMRGDSASASAVSRELVVIGADGYRYNVDLAKISSNADAFVLIGDIRLTRNTACALQEVRLQTTEGTPNVDVHTVNQGWRKFMHNTYEPDSWVEYSSGNHHTIKLSGDFIISGIEVTLQNAGYKL